MTVFSLKSIIFYYLCFKESRLSPFIYLFIKLNKKKSQFFNFLHSSSHYFLWLALDVPQLTRAFSGSIFSGWSPALLGRGGLCVPEPILCPCSQALLFSQHQATVDSCSACDIPDYFLLYLLFSKLSSVMPFHTELFLSKCFLLHQPLYSHLLPDCKFQDHSEFYACILPYQHADRMLPILSSR